MKMLTISEAARTFAEILDRMERDQEEVIVVRDSDNHNVARIIPEPASGTALDVLSDLYGTLDDSTAEALSNAMEKVRNSPGQTLAAFKNPWAS
jgi:hypothetical protein